MLPLTGASLLLNVKARMPNLAELTPSSLTIETEEDLHMTNLPFLLSAVHRVLGSSPPTPSRNHLKMDLERPVKLLVELGLLSMAPNPLALPFHPLDQI